MIGTLEILPKELDSKLQIFNCGDEKGDVRENKMKLLLRGTLYATEVDV